jgi:tRNA threonylcarbamoyl adenosine modification protein YjeE
MEHSKNLQACKLSYPLADEAETLRFGQALSTILRRGDCLLFYGDLGMGGILNGLAHADGLDHIDVPSPTFTLVQIYNFSQTTCYHYDLYRLPDDEDNEYALMEIGFTDSLDDGVVLAEWPERLGHAIPNHALRLTLHPTADADGRICTLDCSAESLSYWTDRLHHVKGLMS